MVCLKAKKLNHFIQYLIESGIIPGLTVLVGMEGEVVFQNQTGFISLLPEKEELTADTIYDVASLTKPLVTSFLVLYLIEKNAGTISIETTVKHFFPSFPYDITLGELLTHTSGLPAWAPLYLFGDNYRSTIERLPLQYRRGKRVVYSCLGYILLHDIICKLGNSTFEQLAQEIIFTPLELTDTYFNVPEEKKRRVAPTENGNNYEQRIASDWLNNYENGKYLNLERVYKWRDKMIRGETHDINSFHLGGTAGNAGLFSTASDIFRMAQEFFPSTASILTPPVLDSFWKKGTQLKQNHRTFGFRKNSGGITSAGKSLSEDAIGHSGFTGTSLWLDWDKERVYILLSNRVHPQYKAMNFDAVRRKIHRFLSNEIEAL